MLDVLIEFERIVIPDDNDNVSEESNSNPSVEVTSTDTISTNQTSESITPVSTTVEEEIDDFDFLGDDYNVMTYLKRDIKDPDNCLMELFNDSDSSGIAAKSENEIVAGVRKNPYRKAKEGVSYKIGDDDDDTDDYCKYSDGIELK